MDQIGEEEPPGRSILTFSSPFLLRMLTTPFIMPRARYWPSFVHLQSIKLFNVHASHEGITLLQMVTAGFHLPTACYFAAHFMFVNRFLLR